MKEAEPQKETNSLDFSVDREGDVADRDRSSAIDRASTFLLLDSGDT